jgi:DNA-binding NarL/FixJ family response regulator
MNRTISIIEPHAIYRRMLADMIRSIGDYDLRHVLSDMADWEVLLRDPSDFVLVEVDASAFGIGGYGVVERLSGRCGTSCIVCTFDRSGESVRRAFDAGASGYMLKDSAYAEFRTNLELALRGGIPMSSEITQLLISSMGMPPTEAPSEGPEASAFVVQVEAAVDDFLGDASVFCCNNLSDYLSRRMGMSYGHLSTLYSRERGFTLRTYRQERRIHDAKRLLRTTTHTLTVIATQLEFSSVAHLSSSFKGIAGLTPTEYRRGCPGTDAALKDASGTTRA